MGIYLVLKEMEGVWKCQCACWEEFHFVEMNRVYFCYGVNMEW
jgi:hypothetical protein